MPPGRKKGQSVSAEIRRQWDPEKIAAELLALASDTMTPARERAKYYEIILERAEGRPLQRSVAMRLGPGDLDHLLALPPAQRLELIDRERARRLLTDGTTDAALVEDGDGDTTEAA